jgi:hypothetical protein
MLRVLVVTLLAGASVCTAHASEHYREVWNPPEARHAPHASRVSHHTAHRPTVHRLTAKHNTKAKPARVTASASKSTKRAHATRSVSLDAAPHVQLFPPQLTPEGNILRVDSRGSRPEVSR